MSQALSCSWVMMALSDKKCVAYSLLCTTNQVSGLECDNHKDSRANLDAVMFFAKFPELPQCRSAFA